MFKPIVYKHSVPTGLVAWLQVLLKTASWFYELAVLVNH